MKTISWVLAVILCTVFSVVTKPVPKPPQREVLKESLPPANEMRIAYQVDGVSESRFYIQSPNVEVLNKVSVSEFGATPENKDNSEALNSAFVYCKENLGTHLVFEQGIYYVSDALILEGIKDCCIDGNGAKIIYDYDGAFITLRGCECLEIRSLTFDWDWEKLPLGALAKAVDVEGEKNTLDFVFDVPEFAREDMFYAISQCDEESGTYGAKGTFIESYEGQNPDIVKSIKKISDDTVRMVHNGTFARFGGHKYVLRSVAYGGSLFNITDKCKDITFDGLSLYGGTGMGVIVGGRTSHFALRNLFIGPDPAYKDTRFVSLDADAVHINDADGCFIIENCDFSFQGDDDVNINNGIGLIESVKGRTVEYSASGGTVTEPGDTVVFRDENFEMMEYKATVESYECLESRLRKVTFLEDLPDNIVPGCTLFNTNSTGGNYVIRNNYFHEHRARGLLLQTHDGLVENNKFYKMSHDAIRIVMDIKTGAWYEGTGADNIEIRNNVFEQCAYTGVELIEIGTHIADKSTGSYAFTNIRIIDNEFRNISGLLMAVNNVNNFVFKGNTITLGDVFRSDVGQGRSYFLKDCANVDFSHNIYTDAKPLSFTKIARSDSLIVWARVNRVALKKEEVK